MARKEYQYSMAGVGEPELGDLRSFSAQPVDGGWECTVVMAYRDTEGVPTSVNDSKAFAAQWVQSTFPPTGPEIRAKVLEAFTSSFDEVPQP